MQYFASFCLLYICSNFVAVQLYSIVIHNMQAEILCIVIILLTYEYCIIISSGPR